MPFWPRHRRLSFVRPNVLSLARGRSEPPAPARRLRTADGGARESGCRGPRQHRAALQSAFTRVHSRSLSALPRSARARSHPPLAARLLRRQPPCRCQPGAARQAVWQGLRRAHDPAAGQGRPGRAGLPQHASLDAAAGPARSHPPPRPGGEGFHGTSRRGHAPARADGCSIRCRSRGPSWMRPTAPIR